MFTTAAENAQKRSCGSCAQPPLNTQSSLSEGSEQKVALCNRTPIFFRRGEDTLAQCTCSVLCCLDGRSLKILYVLLHYFLFVP
eukprot:4074578-Amphidinium_carterae.1